MSQDQQEATPASDGHPAERPVVVRHRQHRFPGLQPGGEGALRLDREIAASDQDHGRSFHVPTAYRLRYGSRTAGRCTTGRLARS